MKRFASLICGLLACLRAAAAPLELARTALVVPENAPESVRFAAEELRDHLQLMTGNAPPIFIEGEKRGGDFTATIWLGACRRAREAGLSDEGLRKFGFIIRRNGDELFLFGCDAAGNMAKTAKMGSLTISSGTLFAVYDFLDRELGVRHIWPGPLGTVVRHDREPKIDDIPERRGGHWGEASLFWAADFSSRAPQWEASGDFAAAQRRWLWRQKFCVIERNVFSGHSFKNYWKRFHGTHPDFFAMLPDGQRRRLIGDEKGTRITMCVSNSDLAKQVAADYGALFRKGKASGFLGIGENDSPGMCTCPACRAWDAPEDGRFATHPYWSGKIIPTMEERFPLLDTEDGNGASAASPSLADRYCRFYLAVQRETRKIDPTVRICGYAYANYAEPPRHVKLNDGIIISVVNWCYFPFTDARMRESERAWDQWRATGAQLTLRPNSTHSGHNMPIFYGRKLGNAFLHAKKHGALAVSYDSLIGQWGAQSASYYCLGRLNARPDLTVDQVMEEYYSAFGPAAGKIREYMELLERVSDGVSVEAIRKHTRKLGLTRMPAHKNWLQAADAVFTSEFFVTAGQLLDKAAEAARSDPEALARVRYLQTGLEHAKRTFDVLLLSRGNDREAFLKAQKELLAYRRGIAGQMTSDLSYLYLRERSGSGWHR